MSTPFRSRLRSGKLSKDEPDEELPSQKKKEQKNVHSTKPEKMQKLTQSEPRRPVRPSAVQSSLLVSRILKEYPGARFKGAHPQASEKSADPPAAKPRPDTPKSTFVKAVLPASVQRVRPPPAKLPKVQENGESPIRSPLRGARGEPAESRPPPALPSRGAAKKSQEAPEKSFTTDKRGKSALKPAPRRSTRVAAVIPAPAPAPSVQPRNVKRKRDASPTVETAKKPVKRTKKVENRKKRPEEWSFPCRTEEFVKILQFVEERIEKYTQGCMLVEGVPGTGKTATVHQVIKYLRWREEHDNLPPFLFCEINGIKLSDPSMTYVHLAKVVLGEDKKLSSGRALQVLSRHFEKPADDQKTVVVLLDEMDKLSTTKKQKVIYNLINWPQLIGSQLIVVAISNTMDLPEKMLMARTESRIADYRLSFDPYTKKDLPEIIHYHLTDATLDDDAMTLVCMRVAAKTGDARGALNIARRARAIAAERTGKQKSRGQVHILLDDVSTACNEIDSSPKILYMKNASLLEKIFLRSLTQGNEEGAEMEQIIDRVMTDYIDKGIPCPSVSMCLAVANRLCAMRILVMAQKSPAMCERRLDLLCNACDVQFATKDLK